MKKTFIVAILILLGSFYPSFANEYDIANYTIAINSISDPYEKAENYANRAGEFMLTGDYQNAINDATKAIKIGYDRDKYDFVEWALTVYYTRAISYQYTKNYTAAIADYTTYIKEATKIRKYYNDPHIELLLGNCYYLRVVAELEQYPLIRSKADGKIVHYANMHDDMLRKFNDLEMAIKIYSGIDSQQAKKKKALTEELLKDLKATYYK